MLQVEILLSVFNGAQFLREQLDSIVAQDYRPIRLLVRNDGSTDQSADVLAEYTRRHSWITTTHGENIGVVRSFFELLSMSSSDAVYFAFCDQDDVWLPHKVGRAVMALERSGAGRADKPFVYGSPTTYVDSKLKFIGRQIVPYHFSFAGALDENELSGCTLMFNRVARDAALRADPNRVLMHDWWFFLIGLAFGRVLVDDESFVLYRQHANNHVGARRYPFARLARRSRRWLRGFLKYDTRLGGQAAHLADLFGDQMTWERLAVLDRFLCRHRSSRNAADKKYIDTSQTGPAAGHEDARVRPVLSSSLEDS